MNVCSPHVKKCTRAANYFIGSHPGTQVAPLLVTLCLYKPYEGAWLKDILDYGVHYVGVCESGFNLSSDDNRVCAWRPRGERLNPAFALQQHTAPTAGNATTGLDRISLGKSGHLYEQKGASILPCKKDTPEKVLAVLLNHTQEDKITLIGTEK
ncbi:hypothetical protein TNCV_1993441 [Trichonephila clavipes]|nr:hypothetical protein TNCV_1993441 [Trichonephila clavipes]